MMLIRCAKEYDNHEKLNFQKIVFQQVEVIDLGGKSAGIFRLQLSINGSSNDYFSKKLFK